MRTFHETVDDALVREIATHATCRNRQDFRTKVSEKVKLVSDGLNRYRVLTPFRFDDGDHLVIVLKRDGDAWMLSDEAHTYMHLSYDIDVDALGRGTRETVITNTLSVYEVEDRQGEMILRVLDERYGDALYSFVQALLAVYGAVHGERRIEVQATHKEASTSPSPLS